MPILREIQPIQALPFNVNPWIDITDQLPSRPNDPEMRRTVGKITHISVHHSGVEGGTPQGYANYHVNELKWFHIGYHIVVSAAQTYQTNDLLTFSYHTSGQNHYTVGISVSGNFTKRNLTEVERKNLYAAILTCMDIFNVPIENVLGHDEFPNQNTACPAFDMHTVREDLKTIKMKMMYAENADYAKERAFKIANQILFFYNLAQGKNPDGSAAEPGNIEWGKNVLLQLDPFMVELNLL